MTFDLNTFDVFSIAVMAFLVSSMIPGEFTSRLVGPAEKLVGWLLLIKIASMLMGA